MTEVNYKSICCEQIPELFLDKLIAKKHFSKFGKISRFILRPKRLSCTVEYENEADAERALEEAGVFNGQEFPINFADREVGHVQNTEEWVDADVQAELDAMGAGQNQLRQLNPNFSNRIMSAPVKRNSPQRSASKMVETVPVPTPPKIDTALRSELENILRQPAFTAEERYRILDARDKLIRLTSVKQTDIAKAESRRGTCPDMCPEKERLMRDFQRQVAIFEINKASMIGSISHRHAIKEYSRSSADQEVPLLHELRPANVLKMTMLYLMSRVMDQLDTTQVNVSDWFHFVWDRTRSIRKDITQQEICSLEAVELVEQCARFHIHCAARLVAEDPSVFDKKINAENLTKCLQTLKYLYHDLRLKNIPCPQEAEFRGYIVLLNLGNSNFLWEVKQLPEHIQQSKEIKRAMAYYNVLQNNNYVRFFNMVREKETSYLSACILLGYFTRLRLRALEAIVKSHNWRKNSVFIPLNYFTKILGFEDDQSASQFFQFHGLMCDNERGVLLEKPQPAVDYCMDRALELVEAKRTVSVGECVCGHPLESPEIFENHQPHSSFDENGILRLEAWNAEDQLRGDEALKNTKQQNSFAPANRLDTIFKIPQTAPHTALKQTQPQPQQSQQPSFKLPTSGFSIFASTKNEPSKAIESTDSLFNTAGMKNNSGTNLFNTSSVMFGATGSTDTKNIFGNIPKPTTVPTTNTSFFPKPMFSVPRNDNVFQYFHPVATDFGVGDDKTTIRTQAAQEEALRKQKLEEEQANEEEKRRELERIQKEKLEEAERQRKAAEAAEERAAAERKRQKLAELEENTKRETDALLSFVIDAEVQKIAKHELNLLKNLSIRAEQLTEEILDEFITDEVCDIATVEYCMHCHDRMLLERYFSKWLYLTRRKIEQRKLLDTMPIWVTTNTREEIVEQLRHPSQMYNLHMIKRYRHGEPCDFHKLLCDEKSELSCRSSVDISKMLSKYLERKMPLNHIQNRKYFKLLFTLPGEEDEIPGFESLCSKFLKQVLNFSQNDEESEAYISTFQKNVALCVRKVCGTPPMNESGKHAQCGECDNVNGIVCFMTCADLESTRRRIHHLFKHSKNFRPLPVAFVVYDNNNYDPKFLARELNLNSLLERNVICGFRFYFTCASQKTEQTFQVNLEHSLFYIMRTFIKEQSDKKNELEMDKTQNWFETCLGEELWRRWQVTESHNPVFRKICTILDHVIGLYHAAIQRLYDIIGENLENEPEFPTELKQFVPKLDEAISMPLGLEHFPFDWKSVERRRALLDFLMRIRLPEFKEPPPMHCLNDLKMWLLDYAGQCITDDENCTAAAYYAIKALIEQLTADDMELLEISERMKIVSFLPVMKPIIFAHINEQLQGIKLPSEIIYRKEKLSCYLKEPWWLSYEAVKLVKVDYNVKSNLLDKSIANSHNPEAEIEAVLKRAAEVSHIFEGKLNSQKNNSQYSVVDSSLLHQLDQTMHELEATKVIGVNDLKPPTSKRRHKKDQKENKDRNDLREEPERKRFQTVDHSSSSSSHVNDIIARALSVIEKANATEDAKFRLDYNISKLNL